MLTLQRTVGNAAVARLLRPGAAPRRAIQRNNGHPLARDEQTIQAKVLDSLRAQDPQCTLADLLLERSSAAKDIFVSFKSARYTGEADVMLLKAILATAELHRRGAIGRLMKGETLSGEEAAFGDLALSIYSKKEQLQAAYGLDPWERKAIEAYSDANKNVEYFDPAKTQANPYFMGKTGNWGLYADGWDALTSAMRKLPSLGDLGLQVTTYRAPRAAKQGDLLEMLKLTGLKPETNIMHGMATMDMGQRHFLSTAITYNAHWSRAGEVGGMIAITGTSGRFINPFGVQGLLDGAEILYPPGVVTMFEGVSPEGYEEGGHTYPVAHLRETGKAETGQAVVEDLEYQPGKEGRTRHPQLDAAKMALVEFISNWPSADEARAALSDFDKDLMYLAYDELIAVKSKLQGSL